MTRDLVSHEMTRHVLPEHNSRNQYERGGKQLSFEFKLAREAGLQYDVAKRIFDVSGGLRLVVDYLIAQKFPTREDVDRYVKWVGCWADGTDDEISDALYEYITSHHRK